MIQVSINRTCARLQTTEPLTSGMIGKQMQLAFDSSWNGLRKTAVFSDGKNTVSLMDSFWGDNNTITIPHEVLAEAGRTVIMGVYGYKVNGDETILAIPSVYAELGKVKKGADPEADPTADPTLPVYAQLEWKIDHFEVPEEQIAEQVQEYLDEHPIEIQPATETVLGAVKVGEGLSVTPDGTLSADSIDAYTKAETDALLDGKQPIGDYATSGELDALANIVDGKADISDIPSLDGYATESYVQNYHDNTKQDVITDLSSIRSGAALGATALQSVPSTYRTASAQDVIDSGKQDKLIAGQNITIAADGKTISASGGGESYDDTELRERIEDIEAKESTWNDKQDKDLVVSITQSGATYTADKTNAEIYAAWQSGREVIASLNAGNSKIPCTQSDATSAYFSLLLNDELVESGTIAIVTLGGAQTVTVSMTALQPKTIADTAGYFTTDTVEGALAEIGGTLDGLEDAINTIRGVS